jgi:putative alpha-1,2-mannosidase
VTAETSTHALFSNPVHRYYQGAGRPAGFSGHHSLHFSQKAKSYGIIQGYNVVTRATADQSLEGESDRQGPVAVFYEFDRDDQTEVILAAGSSFVSRDKAEENLQAELSMTKTNATVRKFSDDIFDFEAVVTRVTQRWDDTLSVVQVADGSEVITKNMMTWSERFRYHFRQNFFHEVRVYNLIYSCNSPYSFSELISILRPILPL